MPYYDTHAVPAHGTQQSNVFLINEAPGKNETAHGIPLYGMQGANLCHSLYKANIQWATQHGNFIWPQDHSNAMKDAFLETRRTKMTCTNSFDKWPKASEESTDFVDPANDDILSALNKARLQQEISRNHTVILLCGIFSYLACNGTEIEHPSDREFQALHPEEIARINNRLNSNIQHGWYMGHTRRWSLANDRAICALQSIARAANWPIVGNNG